MNPLCTLCLEPYVIGFRAYEYKHDPEKIPIDNLVQHDLCSQCMADAIGWGEKAFREMNPMSNKPKRSNK